MFHYRHTHWKIVSIFRVPHVPLQKPSKFLVRAARHTKIKRAVVQLWRSVTAIGPFGEILVFNSPINRASELESSSAGGAD